MNNFYQTEEPVKSFFFTAVLKVATDEEQVEEFQEKYPGLHTFSCTSRVFFSFEECASSCRSLMEQATAKFNKAEEDQFKLGSEVNPVHSGNQTLSKDWMLGEISRLWIYRKSMEKTGHIHAVGQARIYSTIEENAEISLLN